MLSFSKLLKKDLFLFSILSDLLFITTITTIHFYNLSVLTQNVRNPKGYGRVVKKNNLLISIIEENECSNEEKLINEINTGIFLISKKAALNLKLIKKNKNKNEFYITDLVNVCLNKKLKMTTFLNNKENVLKCS